MSLKRNYIEQGYTFLHWVFRAFRSADSMEIGLGCGKLESHCRPARSNWAMARRFAHGAVPIAIILHAVNICGCGVTPEGKRAEAPSAPPLKQSSQSKSPQEAGPPRINVEQKDMDLGDWPAEVQLSHVFKLRNTGGMPLEAKVISKSCGCISAILGADKIPPGESGEVKLEYASDATGTFRTGPQSMGVLLSTNDPSQPELNLTLRARLVLPVEVQPAAIQFGSLEPLETTSQTLTILCRKRDVTPRVLQVTATSPKLRITPKEETQSNEGVRTDYVVDFLGAKTEDDSANVVTVTTNDPTVPVVEIPVRFKVHYQLVAHPQRVVMTRVSSSGTLDRAVELVRNDPQVPAPTRVDCSNQSIKATVEPTDKDSTWMVRLNVLENAPRESFRTEVDLLSDSGELLAVVPVYVSPQVG